jgi:hypothetical protein
LISVNPMMSALLISGFGVQVPDGAPPGGPGRTPCDRDFCFFAPDCVASATVEMSHMMDIPGVIREPVVLPKLGH